MNRSLLGLPSAGISERPRRRRVVGGVAACGILLVVMSAWLAAGEGATRAAVTRPLVFPGGPHFVLSCGFSHRNNDDPIVFSEEPGRSHNHTYIGNFSVDASTTPSSLLGGRSTCDFEADASAYWMPTLYVGRRAVLPLAGFAYYVKRTSTPVSPFPAGLKMIAGNAAARRPQPRGIAAWACGELGNGRRYATVPACARDHLLQLQITFPNCWNGTGLDSADHKRHMAYASAGRCPASHPTPAPTLIVIVLYPDTLPQAQVASGRFAIHADFMNGWNQTTLAGLVAELNR